MSQFDLGPGPVGLFSGDLDRVVVIAYGRIQSLIAAQGACVASDTVLGEERLNIRSAYCRAFWAVPRVIGREAREEAENK